MERSYLTDDMKWVIIIALAVVSFFIVIGIITIFGKLPPSMDDFSQAKYMCGNKGVAHFSYRYNWQDEKEIPDVTCK